MINIFIQPLAGRDRPRSLLRLSRLQEDDGHYTINHIYRGLAWDDGSGWDFGTDSFQPWSASGDGQPPYAWSYLYSFVDGTYGVSRIRDVNEALAALGYEVDRRGDARD